jgi:hypothetical protein
VSAEFPNVRILDWGSIAAADAARILRGDGHHLTNDGRLALASTVAGVMGQAPAAPGKCLSTAFHNDRGTSVNGSDTPPPRPVGKATPTTVKPQTSTTVKSTTPTTVAGVVAPTTQAPTTVATTTQSTQASAPTTAAPGSQSQTTVKPASSVAVSIPPTSQQQP